MSNRIIAVDLGAWSVKVAIAQPGLRHATLTGFAERVVPPDVDGEPAVAWEERAARVLAQIAREHRIDHDSVFLAVPGDQLFTHVLEFAFKNLRRAELEKAVGAELEGVVPVELEDMVYTFEPLPQDDRAPRVPGPLEPVDPTGEIPAGRIAPPSPGMRVLTYAMPRARAETWIDLATRAGAPPRGLVPEAGPMARLVERAPSLAATRGHGPVAVVDLGHARTGVVVLRAGKPVYARTIARGGKQLTDAIARHWRMPLGDAERAKHSDGFVASSTMPATSEAWSRISEVTTAELHPLARDLRQSFAACRARTGTAVAAIVLVGGGSRLRGVDHFLSEQLGLPVTGVVAGDVEAMFGGRLGDAVPPDAAALALGMINDAATGRPLFDLRQGPLAARVDLSFLRARAGRLGAAAIAIVGCATASGWAAHYKLRKAERVLTERLAIESTEEFGDPQTADAVLGAAGPVGGAAVSPLPKMTAWDILLDLNQRMPARDRITLDLEKVEIDSTRVLVSGTATAVEEVDAIESALKEQTCFQDVDRGSVQQLADGKWQFEFSMKNACM
jgi:general secretion pathway protein L